jgi:hypothetical protein
MHRFLKEMPREVIAALECGRKIEAIKLLQGSRGLDLKEAREVVERYEREHPRLRKHRGVVGGGSHGMLFWLVLILLLGLLMLFSDRL